MEQLEQYDKPEVLVYLPFSHSVHVAEPDPEDFPAGPEEYQSVSTTYPTELTKRRHTLIHAVQVTAFPSLKVPPSHREQVVAAIVNGRAS